MCSSLSEHTFTEMSGSSRERAHFVPVSRNKDDGLDRSVPQVLFAGRGTRAAPPPPPPQPEFSAEEIAASHEDTMRRLEQQAKVIALQGQKIHELEDRFHKAKAQAQSGAEEDVSVACVVELKLHSTVR